MFFSGDFNAHHKNWLTYFSGTDGPGELFYNFLSQMTVLKWLTFLLGSVTVILSVLLSWIISSDASIVLQWLSLHWEILITLLSQFLVTFFRTQKEMLVLLHTRFL